MKFRNKFMKYYVHANEAPAPTDDGGDIGESGDDLTGGEGGQGGGGPDEGQETENPDNGDGAAAYWPDDWQSKVSKGDEKLGKFAGRYASPEAMFDALVSANNRIRSGELKSALPDNPKPEELAQWRKDNGIPEKAEDYDLKFESGLVIGENDKPAIDKFLEAAHAANMTPDQVKAAIEWNEGQKEAQVAVRQEMDNEQRTSALDALNEEWGGNFRRNVNMVEGLITMIPEGVREEFASARLPDGTALFNHPDILRGFAAIAHELNPAGSVVPASGGDPMKGVNEEIAQIEELMKTNRTAYNKDEEKQARYRELLSAREKMSARG